MEPQAFLLGRLPHVAQLAFPGAGVLWRVRAEAPAFAHLVGDVLADQLCRPAVHGTVAGGVDHEVGRQLGAVVQHHGVLCEVIDLALGQLDLAVGHQLRCPDVDVRAGPTAQVLEEQAGVVGAEVEVEAGLLEPVVELLVALPGLVALRFHDSRQHRVGQRGEDQVCLVVVDSVLHRFFRVEVAKGDVHQRIGLDDMGGGTLHHGDVCTRFPKCCADVVGRVVGTDHHDLLALVLVGTGVLAGMLLLSLEDVLSGELRHVGHARHAGGQHQLLGLEHHLLAVTIDLDGPFLRLVVPGGGGGFGLRPVIQLHDPGVHFQPVADLVLRREYRPVIGEGQVGQVVVPDRVMQAERLVALAP